MIKPEYAYVVVGQEDDGNGASVSWVVAAHLDKAVAEKHAALARADVESQFSGKKWEELRSVKNKYDPSATYQWGEFVDYRVEEVQLNPVLPVV